MDASLPRPIATTPIPYAVAILGLIAATIAGAFAFQAAGYAPCELCLEERLPYYAGLPLAAVALAAVWRRPGPAAWLSFALLTALFVFSAGFGAYHAGVEWGWWAGPSDCTGALTRATSNADFLHQLQTAKVARCDAVAIRILGLSLAGWNALVSLAIAGVALAGLSRNPLS